MPNQPVLAYSDLPQMGQGALSGWMRGMNAQTSEDQQVANRRDQDLSYDRLKNLYNQEMIQTPVMAAQATNALSAAQNETTDWQSGKNAQLSAAKKDTELADYVSKKSSAELVKMQNQGQVYLAAEQMASPTQSGPADLAGVDNGKWQGIRQMAKAAGLPDDLFPEQWTPEVQSKLHQGAQIAVQTAPYIQKMNEIHAQTTSHENIAKGNNAATVEAARISGINTSDRALMNMTPQQRLRNEVDQKMTRGEAITDTDIEKLKTATRMELKLQMGADLVDAKKNLVTEYYASKESRQKAAKEVGLKPDAGAEDIAQAKVDQAFEAKVDETVYGTLSGATIIKNGQKGVSDGHRFIPDENAKASDNAVGKLGNRPNTARTPAVPASPAAVAADLAVPTPTAPVTPTGTLTTAPTASDIQRRTAAAQGGPQAKNFDLMPKTEADVQPGKVYVGKGGKLYKKDDSGWHEVKP